VVIELGVLFFGAVLWSVGSIILGVLFVDTLRTVRRNKKGSKRRRDALWLLFYLGLILLGAVTLAMFATVETIKHG